MSIYYTEYLQKYRTWSDKISGDRRVSSSVIEAVSEDISRTLGSEVPRCRISDALIQNGLEILGTNLKPNRTKIIDNNVIGRYSPVTINDDALPDEYYVMTPSLIYEVTKSLRDMTKKFPEDTFNVSLSLPGFADCGVCVDVGYNTLVNTLYSQMKNKADMEIRHYFHSRDAYSLTLSYVSSNGKSFRKKSFNVGDDLSRAVDSIDWFFYRGYRGRRTRSIEIEDAKGAQHAVLSNDIQMMYNICTDVLKIMSGEFHTQQEFPTEFSELPPSRMSGSRT